MQSGWIQAHPHIIYLHLHCPYLALVLQGHVLLAFKSQNVPILLYPCQHSQSFPVRGNVTFWWQKSTLHFTPSRHRHNVTGHTAGCLCRRPDTLLCNHPTRRQLFSAPHSIHPQITNRSPPSEGHGEQFRIKETALGEACSC